MELDEKDKTGIGKILDLYKSGAANKGSAINAINFLSQLNAPVPQETKEAKTQAEIMRQLENRSKL